MDGGVGHSAACSSLDDARNDGRGILALDLAGFATFSGFCFGRPQSASTNSAPICAKLYSSSYSSSHEI